ncbi:MAG: exo-alpha-sialidase [Verrucomicrobia bacterium]|nr:exo-alpha-sialidase [Verrucomicrobiota bacterium]
MKTKTNHNKTGAQMLALCLTVSTALSSLAQTPAGWETVLDYQFIDGGSSFGGCIAADALGNVFAGGVGYPATGFGSGLVLKTDTTAVDWFLSDDTNPSPPQTGSSVAGLAFDATGNLYSAGTLWNLCTKTSCPGSFWYVRKSSDRGATWATVDLFQSAAGKSAGSGSVAGDSLGNVYVSGSSTDADGASHWLVRKSADGGQTWASIDDLSPGRAYGVSSVPGVGLFAVGYVASTTTGKGNKRTTTAAWLVRRSVDGGGTWATVDVHQPPPGYGAYAFAVASDAEGRVFVAGRTTILIGSGHTATAVVQWLVRSSSDGGISWSTVDAFSFVAGKGSVAQGLGRDPAGNIVVVGTGIDALGSNHWLVRSPDAQGSWQTVDDYQLAAGQRASASDVGADAGGNLLVVGSADDATGVSHWIVRRVANSTP